MNMRDIPMLFSPPMVLGTMRGNKTETRRFGFRGKPGDRIWVRERWAVAQQYDDRKPSELVAKAMTVFFHAGGSIANDMQGAWKPAAWPGYAQRPDYVGKSRVSLHMPKWMSRITLLVDEVRRERLWDIDDAGAIREGIVQDDGSAEGGNPWYLPGSHFLSGVNARKIAHRIGQHSNPRDVYRDLWANLNGLETWEANPEVTVISFRPILMNIEDEELAYAAQDPA